VILDWNDAICSTDFFVQASVHRYKWAYRLLSNKLVSNNFLVLDIGCGVGYGTRFLSDLPNVSRSIGIDLSASAVRFAASHFKSLKTEYVVGDALRLPFKSNQFDAIVSFEVCEHVRDVEEMLKETGRVLGQGGTFLASTPNASVSLKANPHHLREFYSWEFASVLRSHFRSVEISGQTVRGSDRVKSIDDWLRTVLNARMLRQFLVTAELQRAFCLLTICREPISNALKSPIVNG